MAIFLKPLFGLFFKKEQQNRKGIQALKQKPDLKSEQLKGQCEASTVCARHVAGGSLTGKPKGLFAVSWPRQLDE